MKKLFACLMLLGMLESCQQDFTLTTPPPPPVPCENTIANYTIQLDFSKTTYKACPVINLQNSAATPPTATAYNFLRQNSYGDFDFTNNPSPGTSYFCQITSKNLQPSETPTNPCIMGIASTTKALWGSAGSYTQQVQGYLNHGTGFYVDYIDACQGCYQDYNGNATGTVKYAQPYYISATMIPSFQSQAGAIVKARMFDQLYQISKNCH